MKVRGLEAAMALLEGIPGWFISEQGSAPAHWHLAAGAALCEGWMCLWVSQSMAAGSNFGWKCEAGAGPALLSAVHTLASPLVTWGV